MEDGPPHAVTRIEIKGTAGPVCEAADWHANCGHDSCYLIQEETGEI